MKYTLLVLAVLGIIVSSLALREHYREYGDSPCSINERWDCGLVNHSPFAVLDRKSTRLNSSHEFVSRMPSSA